MTATARRGKSKSLTDVRKAVASKRASFVKMTSPSSKTSLDSRRVFASNWDEIV